MSLDSNQQEIIKKLKTTSTITSSTTSPPFDSDSDSNANSITSSNPSSSKSKSKPKSKSHSTNIHPSNIINQTGTNHHQSNSNPQSNSNSNLSSNSNSNLSSKRLTRSTYIGDEDHSNSNRKRSSSSDSENGWIPPPPLLPLQTEFLITNQLSNSSLIQSIHQTTNNTHHTLRLAHLKCPDSSSTTDQRDTTTSLETPSFRLIHESELLLGSKRNKSESIQMIKNQPNENENQASNLIFLKKHKTYEMLEKRSKRLEKEKLIHERFKLKSHLNLLKNPMGIDWKTVRSITLRRIKEEERRINQNLNHLNSTTDHQHHQISLGNDGERENEKVERMRWIMVKEAQETLERYDKLLDTRKPVIKARQVLAPPPPPLISISETLPVNSPQSTSSPPIVTNKRQLPASDRNVSKRSKTKIGESEEPVTRPLHISLKLKAPIPKPSTSVSKTKIKIKPKGTVSLNTKQAKVETESSSEGEEEETEEEEDRSVSEVSEVSEEPNRKRSKRSASLNPSTKEPHPAGSIVVPIKGRESLYESENLRRMILEDGLIVGGERRRKVGRKVYGFGVKVPELKSIKFESYLIRLDSMSLQQGLKYSPFLNLNEVLPSHPSSSSSSSLSLEENKKEGNVVQDDDEFGKDWIEFDPRLEEIKALVTKRDEFGMNSGYFDLLDELEGLEDEMKLKGEGKSVRRLMWERVVLSKEEIND